MRRIAAWFCLFIALAGPLASQARIAYGLLLSRSEIGRNVFESGQEIEDEEYDGRDMFSVVTHPVSEPGGSIDLSLPLIGLATILAPISLDAPRVPDPYHLRWKWPPPTARQRCALLQTLLI